VRQLDAEDQKNRANFVRSLFFVWCSEQNWIWISR